MAIITLTSDYGLKDHFVAALKGALYSRFADHNIVDITHQVEAFNTLEAAYILGNTYHHFPAETIHLICVDEEELPERPHLVMKLNNHYFIAADNGVLSLIAPDYKPEKLVQIDLSNRNYSSARDVFAEAATHLSRGGQMHVLGREVSEMKTLTRQNPVIRHERNEIIGTIIYVDRFGNLVTNLSKKVIHEVGRGRRFIINLPKGRKLNRILNHYYEEKTEGNLLAMFNSENLLEIAIFKSGSDTLGGATDLLGMERGDQINIQFI